MNSTTLRTTIAGVCAVASLCFAPGAQAAISGIPEGDGPQPDNTGDIACAVQVGVNAGERWCSTNGTTYFTTFDGAPIDINVAFPPAPASGPDGNFPVVGVFHGWGGSKFGLGSDEMQQWLNDGYAVFSMSDRGWGNSCGGMDPKRLQPVCANGYNHLMDTRFEVRDAQEVFEALADRAATGATAAHEGLIDPQRIGVTGGSYGGGISMALAALKNREMNNDANPEGTLVPWVSEGGKQMQIAAAQPDIPWTDLAYSLMPNGHTLDYVKDSPYLKRGRIGVMKQSFVSGLYGTGLATSNYAPPGTDPDADLDVWFAQINAGGPYDSNPTAQDLTDEVMLHHSSYYIDHSIPPAPLLISNGWTDDLFPPDEAIRFYNRTRSQFPSASVSLLFSDHGHQRGQNKGGAAGPDAQYLQKERHAWFDHYVKGTGPDPFHGVETLTQTCPDTAASGGATGDFDNPNTDMPFRASSWATLAPGEIRLTDAASKTIAPGAGGAGNPAAATAYDPIGGDGACATAPGADVPGTASYRLAAAPAGGFTLMGSPTVIADINSVSPDDQVAARLLDVDTGSGDATLVARALYRPETNAGATPTHQVFQLHPNGYHFAAGHVAKLELLSNDSPYGRVSNGQGPTTISNLELRLPVLETPGALGGLVSAPAAKVLPAGYELASDFLPPGPTVETPGDSDRDGIPNSRDRCPTVIGIADNGGCPESTGTKTRGRHCKKHRAKKHSASEAKKKHKKCKRHKKRHR
jgi:hypothetical protein